MWDILTLCPRHWVATTYLWERSAIQKPMDKSLDPARQRSVLESLSTLDPDLVRRELQSRHIDPFLFVADSDALTIASVIGPLVAEMRGNRLDDLLPNLRALHDSDVPMDELPTRARKVLAANAITTITEFASLTVDSLWGFRAAGRNTVNDYCKLAVRLHLRAEAMCPVDHSENARRQSASSAKAEADDLVYKVLKLSTWAATARKAESLRDVLSDLVVLDRLPDEASTLLADVLDAPIGHLRHDPALIKTQCTTLLESLTEKQRRVFESRILCDCPPTLDDLGIVLEITKERVRQIELESCTSLRVLLEDQRYTTLRWWLQEVRRELGSGVPSDSDVLSRVIATVRLALHGIDRACEIALWLAGPYSERHGWVLLDGHDIPSIPMDRTLFGDGVTITEDQVRQWLNAKGFDPALAGRVLAQSDVKHIDGHWLRWYGTAADKAAALMQLRGVLQDVDALAAAFDGGVTHRTLKNYFRTDDRFIRTGKQQFGLKEWGATEYSSITEALADRIESAGGTIRLSDATNDIVVQHGVSESSVTAYATAPMFVVDNEYIRMRQSDEPYVITHRPSDVPGLFPDPQRDQVHMVLRIDADVERGSGRGLSPGAGKALRLKPGQRVEFSSDTGIRITVTWLPSSCTGPSLSSTRELVLTVGARRDDTVVLSFDLRHSKVFVRLVEPDARDVISLTGLACETGRELQALAASLDCAPEDVEALLRKRRDDRILDAVSSRAS